MKVFVSSTYRDLGEHRKAVDGVIQRLGQLYCGMEYFGARQLEPQELCFSEIEQSDIFVGIYAHRYGWKPDGRKSITEMEFDYAKNLDRLCYIIGKDHPWPSSLIEHEALSQLREFHEKIRNEVTPSYFKTPDNLAMQVAVDLGRWIYEWRVKSRLAMEGAIVKEAAIHRHCFAARGHVLHCLLEDSLFFASWLEPYGVKEAVLRKQLSRLLGSIEHAANVEEVRLTRSARRVLDEAWKLRAHESFERETDCVWVCLAEETSLVLDGQVSPLSGSDETWLQFVSDVPDLTQAMQQKTPYRADAVH